MRCLYTSLSLSNLQETAITVVNMEAGAICSCSLVSSTPEQVAKFLQGPWDTDWILCPKEFPHPFHGSSLPQLTPPMPLHSHPSNPSHAPPLPPPTSAETDNWKYTARSRNEGKVKELTLGCQQNRSANSTLSDHQVYGGILKTPQKHNHNKPLLYIQQLKDKSQIAPATLQLSSLKPNNKSRRRKGSKEMRKRKQAMTHLFPPVL